MASTTTTTSYNDPATSSTVTTTLTTTTVTPLRDSEWAKSATKFLNPGYDEGIFDCNSHPDYPVAFALAVCCPCILNATLKASLDNRPITFCDYLCVNNSYQSRQTIRAKFGLAYAPFNDCIACVCCSCCVVHSDIREFAKREGKPPKFYMFPA